MKDRFPRELKNRRLATGWGQEQLAEAVGVDVTTVRRWERGQRRPRPRQIEALCSSLNTSAAALGLTGSSDELDDVLLILEGLDPLRRRDFLKALLGTMAPLAAVPNAEAWLRLGSAIQRPDRVDPGTIAQLEEVTIHLEELEPQFSPNALMGLVLGHYDTLREMIRHANGSTSKAELYSLAGETAAVAGWLLWDLDQMDAASSFFMEGLEAAREVGDLALGAYLLGCRAVQPTFRERPEVRLRQLDGRTFGFSVRHGSPETRSWLATLAADSHAMAGSPDKARRALDQAQKAMAEPRGAAPPKPRRVFFDEARLAGEVGVCMARLAMVPTVSRRQRTRFTAEGRGVLESALRDLQSTQIKTKPRLMTALGTTYVADGEVEEACRIGHEVLDLGALVRDVEPNAQDVVRLRRQLEPWRDHPAVRHLNDRLHAA